MNMNKKNVKSLEPSVIPAYLELTAPTPIMITENSVLDEVITLNQPFTALRVALPTWSANDCSLEVAVYAFDTDLQSSKKKAPLFTHTITEIRDCEERTVTLPCAMDSGTYVFSFFGGTNGKGGHPGIWCYVGSACEGRLYQNGIETDGELRLAFTFTCTPLIPFGESTMPLSIKPTAFEKETARRHYEAFLSDLAHFPCSITIDGIKYEGFGEDFKLLTVEKDADDKKETRLYTFKHTCGLIYRFKTALYPEYAAYECAAELENPTDQPSPFITDWIVASPTFFIPNAVLCGINGDGGFHHDPYSPYSVQLTDATLTYTSPSGRSTYNRFPYYDIKGGSNGVIFVLGWPGKWKTSFSDQDGHVTVSGCQQTLNTPIPAGEKLISPLACFLEYTGTDAHRVTNLWRHFFIDCNMKKEDGHLFAPHISGGTSWIYSEMKDATDENQIDGIRQYKKNGVDIDYWWMDAGWYYKTEETSLDVWLPVGTWVVDRKRFPSGMKAISDFGHANGVKTLLWFEPEVTRLRDEELGSTSIKKEWIVPGSATRLVDIGNPDFRNWMLDRVFTIMEEGNIDLYRQDYGVGYPTNEMHAADPAGTSGYTENRTYQGYYDYLDRIAARYPKMMLDACAAGGGRNDLTTMRRAVPLHKTDADYSNFTMKTAMHQALFAWLPYFGTPLTGPNSSQMRTPDLYIMRSGYCPFIAFGADVAHPDTVDWEMYRRGVSEWKQIKDFYYADYYPLFAWDGGADAWRGWEFFDPATECGFFQLFRDAQSRDESKQIRLYGLSRISTYRLIDFDGGDDIVLDGATLLDEGIRVFADARASKVFRIQKEE